MPGSCHHRMGHYALRFKPLPLPHNDSSSTSTNSRRKHHHHHHDHHHSLTNSGVASIHSPSTYTPGFLEYSTAAASSPTNAQSGSSTAVGNGGDPADPNAPEFPLVPGPFWGHVANAGLISHTSGKAKEERLRVRQKRDQERDSGSGTSHADGGDGEGSHGSGESVDNRLRTSHGCTLNTTSLITSHFLCLNALLSALLSFYPSSSCILNPRSTIHMCCATRDFCTPHHHYHHHYHHYHH